MSPQQLDGERGTHLDDIYSMGATIYELITSKPPFYSGDINRQIHDRTAPRMMQRRRDLEIEGSPIPGNWEEVIAACLAKDPARRPQSVAEVANRLGLKLADIPAATKRQVERSKKRAAFLIGAAICVAVAAGWYFGIYRTGKQANAVATTSVIESTLQSAPPESSAALGDVSVNTSPAGASVTVGDTTLQSPARFNGLRPGKYSMKIQQNGYEKLEREIEVKEHESVDLGTIKLQQNKAADDPNGVTHDRQNTSAAAKDAQAAPNNQRPRVIYKPTAAPQTSEKPAPKSAKEGYPYGTRVPGKPGWVKSPYSPDAGFLVDVRGLPPGTKMKDPLTNKPFLVP